MNRIAVGVFVILVMAVLSLGWLSVSQSQQIGSLKQQADQLAEDLQSSEAGVLRQHELHLWDQQLFTELDQKAERQRQDSAASQWLTRKELQNETCANTALPESVAIRLRERIHRQAGAGT